MFVRYIFTTLVLFFLLSSELYSATRIVVAQDGAGSELIEHTLPAVTLAATRNVDYLELHVVMTADDQLLVYKDLTLNRLSNVTEIFPDRNREDGNYYVIDFTLDEIRQLRLRNVFDYGQMSVSLAIPTLKEELSLIRRLETLLDKQIGIVLGITNPRFHKEGGKDISDSTLNTLAHFQYTKEKDKLYLQCFDPDELQRIHDRLLPEKQMSLPLIQLIGRASNPDDQETQSKVFETYNYDWLFTNMGMRMVATFASALALPASAIVGENGTPLLGQFIEDVHKYGLKVFALDVQWEEQLPSYASNYKELLNLLYTKAKLDGIYTNSYQEAVHFNDQFAALEKLKAELPIIEPATEQTTPQPMGNPPTDQ